MVYFSLLRNGVKTKKPVNQTIYRFLMNFDIQKCDLEGTLTHLSNHLVLYPLSFRRKTK
jgi:hypothetical protein